jgi:hypothetical protein
MGRRGERKATGLGSESLRLLGFGIIDFLDSPAAEDLAPSSFANMREQNGGDYEKADWEIVCLYDSSFVSCFCIFLGHGDR